MFFWKNFFLWIFNLNGTLTFQIIWWKLWTHSPGIILRNTKLYFWCQRIYSFFETDSWKLGVFRRERETGRGKKEDRSKDDIRKKWGDFRNDLLKSFKDCSGSKYIPSSLCTNPRTSASKNQFFHWYCTSCIILPVCHFQSSMYILDSFRMICIDLVYSL